MAEGLKMFHARQVRYNNRRISVSDIDNNDREGLICEFCAAKISWVKAHIRNGKNISAFLRLQKNEEHASDCKNTVKLAITTLVANSNNVENVKSLIDVVDSKFIFRMNVLIQATSNAKKAWDEMNKEAPQEEKTRKRIRYQKTEKDLSDYFNTAAGVARTRARIEESSDKKTLAELIKIDYNGRKINWNDFFYDEDRYPLLFKNAGKIKHPIAILITIKNEQKYLENRFYALNGEVCIIKNKDKSIDYFSPSLTSNKEDFFDGLRSKDEIIVIGNVKPTTKPWREGKTYKNLNINIINKKQIARL